MDFILGIAVFILFAMLLDTRARLLRAEATLAEAAKRIGALQRAAQPQDAAEPQAADGGQADEPVEPIEPAAPPISPPTIATTVPMARVAEAAALDSDPAPRVAALPEPDAERPVAPVPARDVSVRFENLFGRTLPIWAGGITLAIAGVLIVRYAIDAGFFARVFTPGVQVVAGLLFGLGLIAGAEAAWRNEARLRDRRVPQALAGAGLATLYAAILVAANAYGLIGPALAFAALAGITAGALGLSLRFGTPSAVLGLAGGLAAPALVGSAAPDVPLLAVYLGLTIAGLAGVARMRRWPWLAMAALAGGAGWSLWLILASGALDAIASLSIGGLLLLLAIALPTLALADDGQRIARAASAVIGACQLALLVAVGGFTLLHWGLFALIAAAAGWLAWRDDRLAIVPRVSLALSILLLSIWPDPAGASLALVALILATIHATPLLARMWQGAGLARAQDLVALSVAAPALAAWQIPDIADALLAAIALGGAVLASVAAGLGWSNDQRQNDGRFAWLATAAAGLVAIAIAVLLPVWALPLPIAGAGAALLHLAPRAGDHRIERSAAVYAAIAVATLLFSQPDFATGEMLFSSAESARLVTGWIGGDGMVALLRWAALAATMALFALRATHPPIVRAGQLAGALLFYGALAQVVPARWLMLVPAVAGAAALIGLERLGPQRLALAALAFAGIAFLWAAEPLAAWSQGATASLVGVPMRLDDPMLTVESLLLRLLAPALLLGTALWRHGHGLSAPARNLALVVSGTVAGVALHGLYRIAFAGLLGTDFVATGIPQRLLWSAILLASGWLALRRGKTIAARALVVAASAHLLWYSLFLHNPLWSAQAVGAWPIVNWLIPLFGLPWIAARVARPLLSRWPTSDRFLQPLWMLLVAGFAWATLRQLFHGSMLVVPGVDPAENILRSLLILLLAIGYLLWGIRIGRRDWRIASLVLMLGAVAKTFLFDASGLEGLLRIASFVALGFSLIGIGWLYSRQLARAPGAMQGERK